MKNLTKVQIKEFVEMTDREMKFTVGGDDAGGTTTTTTSGCPPGKDKCTCNGVYKGCLSPGDCWSAC